MTNFFQSSQITSLLNALPYHIAQDVRNKIEEGKREAITTCIYSLDVTTAHRFASHFFVDPQILDRRKRNSGEVFRLIPGQAGCFLTSRLSDLVSPTEEDIKIVIWVIDMDHVHVDDVLERPDNGNRIIKVLNYSSESYAELKNPNSETAKRMAEIKRTVLHDSSATEVCLENGGGLSDMANTFVKKHASSKQIFAAYAIKSQYIKILLKDRVIGGYATFISSAIRSHFDTLPETKRDEINTLINQYLGEALKKGGVALVTNVAGAVFSGLGSLFRSLKGK